MSADIWLEDERGNRLEFGEDEHIPMRAPGKVFGNAFNLTYNLTPMLLEAGMYPWKQMVGMAAADAGVIWNRVVIELLADPDKYRAMNPANGWGSRGDAIKVLSALVTACKANPDAIVGGWL